VLQSREISQIAPWNLAKFAMENGKFFHRAAEKPSATDQVTPQVHVYGANVCLVTS